MTLLWSSWFEREQLIGRHCRGMHDKPCDRWVLVQQRLGHASRNCCWYFIGPPPHHHFLVGVHLSLQNLLLTIPLFVSTTQYTYVYWYTIHYENIHTNISDEHARAHARTRARTRTYTRTRTCAHAHTHTHTHGGFHILDNNINIQYTHVYLNKNTM